MLSTITINGERITELGEDNSGETYEVGNFGRGTGEGEREARKVADDVEM